MPANRGDSIMISIMPFTIMIVPFAPVVPLAIKMMVSLKDVTASAESLPAGAHFMEISAILLKTPCLLASFISWGPFPGCSKLETFSVDAIEPRALWFGMGFLPMGEVWYCVPPELTWLSWRGAP